MLNVIKSGRADQDDHLFSAAHTVEARRAQAWLEAQFRRAEKAGGFTLDNVEVTPVMAEVMLANNTNNRPLRSANITRLRQAIRDGRWIAGASTFRFDGDRTLADGQHRIRAVADEGRSIIVDVRFGVPDVSRTVLDAHNKRTSSDILSIAGFANTSTLAAAARLHYNCENFSPRQNLGIDNDVCLAWVESHPALVESVVVGERVYRALKCSKSAATVANYMIVQSGAPDDAIDVFFDRLCDGLGLVSRRDPIYMLREFLRGGTGGRAHIALGAIINAWNFYRRGKSPNRVYVTEREPFPVVGAW